MVHNPLPDPAAVHPGEAAMLAAVLADLTDDLPKLVYADWLEERGDPRGVFLREFTTAARDGEKLPTPKRGTTPWLDLIGASAVTAARGWELPITPAELLRDALPAFTLKSERVTDANIGVGDNKFGGDPDVPSSFEWPMYQDRPMSFLTQFNLTELSASPACRDLPRAGTLAVFLEIQGDVFDRRDGGGWHVFRFPAPEKLQRRTSPNVTAPTVHFHSCRLTFTETLTLPEAPPFESEDQRSSYREVVSNTELGHQLLGHPRWLQGSSGWIDEVENGRAKYRHLLTLDGDVQVGWEWGDTGLIYFGIAADDLKAGRFDRTVFEMQCC